MCFQILCSCFSPRSFLYGKEGWFVGLPCGVSELFVCSICPLSPAYVMDTHTHILARENKETGFVLACFQLRVPCGALPDLDVSVWHSKMQRHKHRPAYVSFCSDEQVHTPTQAHRCSLPLSQQISLHSFSYENSSLTSIHCGQPNP